MWRCKECGSTDFKEIVAEAETIGGVWNRNGEHTGYGVEVIAVEEVVCNSCGYSKSSEEIQDIAEWVEEGK